MERYLQHPPREPDYRRGRSHRDFMGDLATLAGAGDPAAFLVSLEGEMLRAGPPD